MVTTPKAQEPVWETVAEEAPVMVEFDTVGDVFEAVYEGSTDIDLPEDKRQDGRTTFRQLRFRKDGVLYGINAGLKLREAFNSIPDGTLCRITLMAFVEVGQPSKMKDFRVQVAR